MRARTRSSKLPSPSPDPSLSLTPSPSPSPTSSAPPSMIPLHARDRASNPYDASPEFHIQAGQVSKLDMELTDLTISVPGCTRRSEDDPPPARWRTPEFIFYGIAFVIVVPLLIYWPMRLSLPSNPNYWQFDRRLSPGWLFGRQVDASDPQYKQFRGNFWPLVGLGAGYLIPSHLARRFFPSGPARARFLAAAGLVLITALHGVSVVKILIILAANYAAVKAIKSPQVARAWPALIIIANMAILFANEKSDGYRFAILHPSLGFLDDYAYGGLLPRWHVNFNMTMLRIISFALDAHWRQPPASSAPTDYRGRVSTSVPEQEYSFVNYLAYVLYAPLYIAGPIITFNDFVWQMHHPLVISTRERISYAIRFLACLLTMESILHTMYVVAIKDTKAWSGNGPADLSMIGFWNLIVVWLKLLIPWRFFRLWALLDGVDPPENMVRCVANNYSTLGFWRSWHRSYNLWIVRYIYIPLGGSKRMILATTMVFTFVALWHDLSFRLLAWGWLVSVFIVPELVGRALVPAKTYGHEWWYRHVAAAGGVVNVLLMMSANLVGFVLGLDGMKHLVYELVSTANGWAFTSFACACLFIGVQVMMEYREAEARRGIDRRC